MRKYTIITLIICFFSAFSICRAETVEFLIENSPYYVHKDLIIKEGQTFTAEPGVVIEAAMGAGIIIEGRIDIAGYPKGGEVIFKAVGPYQNYNKGFWKGIIIKSKEKNVIQYTVIQHSMTGIDIIEGSGIHIMNNIITQNKTGISACRLEQLLIARNSFLGNFSDVILKETTAVIENNFFKGSLRAIALEESYPVIRNNNLNHVHRSAVEFDNMLDFQLGENWWGTADEGKIESLMIQKGAGKTSIQPFLKQPMDLKDAGVDLRE